MAPPTRRPPPGPAARRPRQAVSRLAPEGLRTGAVTLVRAADIIEMRSGRGGPDPGDKESAARRSRLPPAFCTALEGELMLLRAQLFSSGLFKEIVCVDLDDGG